MLILLTKIYMAYKLLTWINQVINSIPNDNLCLILIVPDQPLTKSDWCSIIGLSVIRLELSGFTNFTKSN